MLSFYRFLAICLILIFQPAAAQPLYQVSLALPEGAKGNDPEVQATAITQVIERLTGGVVNDTSQFDGLLAQPQEWILSWGFESELDEVSRVATLKVDPAIRAQIQSNGRPIWTQPRPAQWVWILVDQGQGRQPLTEQTGADVWNALQAESARWQLPVLAPDWDAQDRTLVNFSELWGLFLDGVVQAAPRYSQEFTAGRIIKVGDAWQVSVKSSDGRRLDQRFANEQALAAGLFAWWLPSMVAQYAISGEGQTEVSFLDLTPQGYRDVIKFLRTQDAVEGAYTVYSDDSQTRIRLITGARPEQIRGLLAQLPSVVPLDANRPSDAQLTWRWAP